MSSDRPENAERGRFERGEPRVIVLTSPSGGGKTTIARRLMEVVPARFSVSVTTRPPRDGERDGIDYHFVSPDTFRSYIDRGLLLEYEEVYPGRFYGTLREEVDRATRDAPVLLDVEVHGAATVERLFGDDALTLFLRPPSIDVLGERLRRRGTEDEASIRVRLERAEMELRHTDRYDRVILNDDLDTAVAETIRVVQSFLAG